MSGTRWRKGISQYDAEKTLFTIKRAHKTARAAGSHPVATTTGRAAQPTQSGRKFAHFICGPDLPYNFDFISWLLYAKWTTTVGVCTETSSKIGIICFSIRWSNLNFFKHHHIFSFHATLEGLLSNFCFPSFPLAIPCREFYGRRCDSYEKNVCLFPSQIKYFQFI